MKSFHRRGSVGIAAGLGAALLLLGAHRAPARVLEFVQTAEGSRLAEAHSVALSPDGRHLYVGAEGLNVLARNPASGALRFVEREVAGSFFVTVSQDGRHVYAVESGYKFTRLLVYERQAACGALSLVEAADLPFHPWSLALSPDGRHLYTTGSPVAALAVLARDAATGTLRDLGGPSRADDLDRARFVAASPDGRHVYALTGGGLAALARNAESGALAFVETEVEGVGGVRGLRGAVHVAVSPDGRHVYVASSEPDDAVAVFARDPATGALSFVETLFDGEGGVRGLDDASWAAVSPDGRRVYVASERAGAVAVFARDPALGRLSFVAAVANGEGGARGLAGALAVAASPDGRHVYAASRAPGAVTLLAAEEGGGAAFVRAYFSGEPGVPGLGGAISSAVSPGGEHVYVASREDHAVAALARDAASGRLAPVAAYRDGEDGVHGLAWANALALSPGGEHLYVAASLRFVATGAVVAFARDGETGELSFVEAHTDDDLDGLSGATSVVVSPDGRHVYVGGSRWLVALARDPGSGALAFAQELDVGELLYDALSLAISSDGRHLYAASFEYDKVYVFARDAASGTLSPVAAVANGAGGRGLDGPSSLGLSPDGRHLYVSGYLDASVVAFARDAGSGALSFVAAYLDGEGGLDGLSGASDVAFSPEGDAVFVASTVDGSVAVFARDPASGRLGQLELHADGTAGIDGLEGVYSVTVSPDGRFVDLTSPRESAVAVFRRQTGPCRDDLGGVCLGANRFRVELDWRDSADHTGAARALPYGSGNSGLFWFFHPDNWEALVKVLDGCDLNGRFWVFAAATTDVEFTLRVTDELAGLTRTWVNPLGRAAPALTDTDAFDTCDLPPATSGATPAIVAPATFEAARSTADRQAGRDADLAPGDRKTSTDVLLVGLGGQCLDVQGGDPSEGTPVNVFRCHGKPNQRWRLFQRPLERVAIQGLGDRCLKAGRELGPGRAAVVIGECGDDDLWTIEGSYPPGFRLVHAATGSCLDVTGGQTADGTPAQLFPCHGGANQTWKFEGISCRDRVSTRCLQDGRFEVEVDWRDFDGNTGAGRALPFGRPFGDSDSGLFWFFHEGNWELLVKVLDGCGINDRYWVFAAATTDVHYTLRVTDTETGDVREYSNPLGRAAGAVTDTDAFPTCDL